MLTRLKIGKKRAWFTKVAIWVAARLTCFRPRPRARARAQRSGTCTRNRDRREADYDYEHDFKRESCNPELNQAKKREGRDGVV